MLKTSKSKGCTFEAPYQRWLYVEVGDLSLRDIFLVTRTDSVPGLDALHQRATDPWRTPPPRTRRSLAGRSSSSRVWIELRQAVVGVCSGRWSGCRPDRLVFDDTGELLPDGQVVAPHRPFATVAA
ncbi:DUF5999 family protein [Streptomyces sp. NPDC088847]|uniref:DUF5999 family protein n=1 Tax=Streptomyces sp. NPDC088847 TaxID=3365909 RepID=UPI003818DB74